MAVKVIKDNNKKRCACYHCGSILEYSKEDIKKERVHMNEYQEYIVCPACGNDTILNNSVEGKSIIRKHTEEKVNSINNFLRSISSPYPTLDEVKSNYIETLKFLERLNNEE